ncbi:MAG: MoaD/ThiS family protein, partial [Gemmatimonadales bacterium]
MSVTVLIPTPLRGYAGGRDAIEVPGSTVSEVLSGLLSAHEGLRRHLLQDDGRLRNFVNLYLNDTDIRYLSQGDTPVRPGDALTIVPSIAGGSPAAARPAAPEAQVALPPL